MTKALQVLAMTVLLCVSALAQTSGTIAGNVLDPSGAAVPGATVTATNTGTGYVRTVPSNESGAYLLTLMPVGTYTVTAEASGFKPVRQLDVVLSVNQNVRVDLSLELGETTEFVEVSAAVTEVDTRQASITHLMDQKRMIDLPLNGRNPASLIALLPGVTGLSVPDRPSIGGVNLRMNGTNAMMQQFLLDGSPFNAVQRSDGLPLPPPDIVQEFRVQANSFSAEYGRNAGGIISTITKSGTNELHGSLWEYFRNNKLNARNFFDPGVPNLRQNQFGFQVGGPIVRNKTFFLGSYQGMRIREVRLVNSAIPATAAEKAGDFSASTPRPNDPLTGQPFPGGLIPSGRFDPAAVKILGMLPAANTADGRYQEQASQPTDSNQYMVRIDQQIGTKNTLSGKYWRDHGDILDPWPNATNLPYSPGVFDLLIYNWSINDTHTFSPNVINEARFAYTQRDENRFNTVEQDVTDLGIRITPPQDPFLPNVTTTGRFLLATQINGQPTKKDDTLSFSDTLSWLKGSHTIKTGFSMESPLMQGRPQFDNGAFVFNGQITGNALADTLIGRPFSFDQNIGRWDNHRATFWGFFLQDDYKVSPRLTLNLGVRYQYSQRLKHREDWGSNLYFGPNLSLDRRSTRFPDAPPGLLFAGDPGVDPSFYNADKNDWAPRVGIAYDLTGNGKTSIRAGWGVFYQLTLVEIANFLSANPPFVARATFSDVFSLTDPWGSRFQGGVDDPISTFQPGVTADFTFPASLRVMEPDIRNGYIQQYSLSIQHQLTPDTIFEAAYVGNSARKLALNRELNYAIPGPGATTGNTNARRIFLPGTYASISSYDDSGTSNHNGLQFSVKKRYSDNFTYSAAYSWSKTIDISSGENAGAIGVLDPNNLNADRGLSSFDRAHVLTTSLVWDVPYLRNASNPVVRHAIGGWSVAGLWRAASGAPINLVSGGDFALTGLGNQRPNVVGDPVLSNSRSRDEKLAAWFDKNAFVRNGVGELGNLGRNALRGPGEWNVDLNLMKNFRVRESQSLQFRAEFFNLFNHANLGNPNTTFTAANFGRILTASSPRAIQLALRYTF